MISQQPPFPVIDGYPLAPDHADSSRWWVMPKEPSLAMVDGRPQLSLLQYLGGGAGAAKVAGGILQLTTELAVPEDVLTALPGKLAARLGPGTPTPVVTPVLFDAGTIELTVLGHTNAPQPAGSAAPGGPFEIQFAAGGRPSLGGTNQGTFQLVLNESAAEAIAACLDQPELPVIVSYVMSYSAVRPSFTIDLEVDWAKVYSTLRNKLTANAWFAAADIDVEITHALEESGVQIDTVVLGGADSAGSAARTRDKLLDWVLDRLFTPMIPAADPVAGIGDAIADTVGSITRAIIPGASYRLKDIDQNQLRHLDIRATEEIAEVRELRPQGMLGTLLRRLRTDDAGRPSPDWPAVRAGLLSQVELSGFPRLEVAISVVDRFASDGLRGCRVQIGRLLPTGVLADSAEFAFRTAAETQSWVVNLLDEAARQEVWDSPYVYRVIADFDAAAPLRPSGPAISPWRRRSVADLQVDPREAYVVGDVTVATAPAFSFDAFPEVTVELARGLEDPDVGRASRVSLTRDAGPQHWLFGASPTDAAATLPAGPAIPTVGFGSRPVTTTPTGAPTDAVRDGDRVLPADRIGNVSTPGYSWRARYHRPLEAGGEVATDWTPAIEPWLSLPDPMPEKLQVTFFVDLPWTDVAIALLQLQYVDEAAGVQTAVETVTLSAATPLLTRLYAIAAGGFRGINYRLTVKLAAGPLLEGSWRTATDDRVVIDRKLVDQRQVLVRTVGGPLADRRLASAQVELQVRAPNGQPLSGSVFPITAGNEQGFSARFEYLRGDPPNVQVFYQVSAVDPNGFRRVQPWGSSGGDLLVLDLRTLTVTG